MAHNVVRVELGSTSSEPVPIELGTAPADIAYGEGAVWVVTADRTGLVRIDAASNRVETVVDLTGLGFPIVEHLWVAAGEGAVWLVSETSVVQIDPRTNAIVGAPMVVGEEVVTFAVGEGTLWTGSHDDGVIARVDATANAVVATVEAGFEVHGLAVADGSAWVLDEHGFAVVELDPATNLLGTRIPIGFVGANVAAGAGSVWVAPAAYDSGVPTDNDAVARLDTETGRITETVNVGDAGGTDYYEVMFADGAVWVHASATESRVAHIDPVR
jgi:ligand-binding sensor domain-containing protein